MIVFDQLDVLVEFIASTANKPADQVRMLVGLLLQTFIGFFMTIFVSEGTLKRHVFSIVTGMILQFYMYGFDIWHFYLIAIVVYAIMVSTPRQQQQRYVIPFVFIYLSWRHIQAMNGKYEIDVTSTLMILVVKLWGLSFAYKDGELPSSQLNKDQQERKVVHMPNILEYISFCFSIGSCLMGPFHEYSDFINWIELTGNYKTMPRGSKGVAVIKPALTQILIATLCVITHVFFVSVLGIYVQFCGTEEFLTHGTLLYRIYYSYMAMTGQRFMYYTPWSMSDAACIACGISYNDTSSPADGKQSNKAESYNWNRVRNIFIYELETAQNPLIAMANWNQQICVWTKQYVQLRLETPGKKRGLLETLIQFFVVAAWHGYYPYYFYMFLNCGVLVEVAKDIYRSRILFDFIPEQFHYIVGHLCTFLFINYLGTSFMLLTFEKGGNLAKGTSNVIVILLLGSLFILKAFNLPGYAKKLEKKREAAKAEKKDK